MTDKYSYRTSVEETVNSVLDAEADQICGASRYERSADRVDTRAGHYERQLETKAGAVTLKVPKLRKLPFETAIIERYRRREASVEESLVEMYLAGVSVRRVEDITEALWGTRVSSSTVSRLNQKIYRHIEAWRNRAIEGDFPYVYLDGVILKRSWAGEVRNISVLVAIGVGTDGHRQILGVAEGECRHHSFVSIPSAVNVQNPGIVKEVPANSSVYKGNLEKADRGLGHELLTMNAFGHEMLTCSAQKNKP